MAAAMDSRKSCRRRSRRKGAGRLCRRSRAYYEQPDESAQKVTTSKIRGLLSLVTEIFNVENLRTEEALLPESVVKINLMRVRVAYEYGRDTGESVGKDKAYPMKDFISQSHLLEYLKGISTDRADLIRFAHYMEALVAFHRYFGGKEG